MRIGGEVLATTLTGADASVTDNAMISRIENLNGQISTRNDVKRFKYWDVDKSNDLNMAEFMRMAKNIPILKYKDENILKEMF